MNGLKIPFAAGALCLALSIAGQAIAQGVNVELATADQKKDATAAYHDGMKAFDENKASEALDQFRKSFEIVASPNSQLMIARALVHLDRLSEAHAELVQVIELATALARSNPKYQTTADAAQKELSELEPKLAMVSVTVPVALTLNGNPIPATQWGKPLALPPGKAVFQLKASDQVGEQSLDLAAGDNKQISLDLPKPSPPPPPAPVAPPAVPTHSSKRTVGYVVAGAGGVGLVVSTVVLLISQGKVARIADRCGNTSCPLSVTDDADSTRRRETVALFGVGVGIVGVAAGGYLILSDGKGTTQTASAPTPRTALRVGASSVELTTHF
ncbi:MAG TPA: hypothetical protein VL137_01965 [Polyangiaceae bacterium]|jgi:hypothetical protein|nr:hypothetical protein [Polyangiaceae bacterium]